MSKLTSEVEVLHVEVHRRMIENGEWDRILHLLSSKLSESGWADDLLHRAKENSRSMDPLSLQMILQELLSHAQTSVPLSVKREITTLIKQFVREQFEK
ncbi:transcription factor e(y)2-domain-containing protein [Suillus discolor]|uniref:Transcription and mRNA export factor SUS1 n=1 Tax=Suillus discolor TaxID=1912936 RepID=A0A9P7FBP0_9AGAM|nr:transcription factor e(y)2-domain-containing protein [Suillus discolor]KAG2112024.1 transcription factor e(y)2-domain-containing protein [Suillus discolor]